MTKSYLQIKEQEILKQAELLQSIDHPVTKGDHLEGLLLRFLKEELPKRYSIDSGFIIGLLKSKNSPNRHNDDEEGKFRSEEMDIVIFDEQKNVSPLKLLRKRDFYVEGMHGVVSIKSKLTKDNFLNEKGNMLSNLISAKQIKMHSLNYQVSNGRETFDTKGGQVPIPIIAAGFAYAGPSLTTVKKYLDSKIPLYHRWDEIFPDIVAILGKGIVYMIDNVNSSPKYEVLETQDGTLEEFFFQLLRLLNNRQTFVAGLKSYRDFYS